MEAPLRAMPQNLEAEQSVLGSMISDKNCIAQAAESLRGEDFYRQNHQIIFNAMLELFQKDIPVDLITLLEHLKSTDKLEASGGITYVTQIRDSIASTANIQSYIKIVKDKAVLRKLIKSSTDIIEESYSKQDDVEKVLDSAEKRIFDIAENKVTSDFEAMNVVLERGFEQIEKLYNNKGEITGIPSGFPELDDKTSGFQKGDMVLIAARPSMGKTTFALNIAEYAALRAGKSVVIFSLEMSKEQLAYKLLCSEANVDMLKLRTGNLEDEDWDNIARASGPLADAKIFIDDTAGVSVMEMRSKCRRLKIEHGIDLIVIDYLQLMSGNGESRQQEVSEISRSIKALAKEIGCPVIALSQLSRAPEQRNDHRPMLSDLRESGSIEQDADLVMFLYRDEYYNKETEQKNVAECIIAKQRNGPTGTVNLAWLGQYSKFGRLDVIHQE
ncbi:replicative DNA helicase [Clostridium acetobutylicum]|uniref:Replicative DNA helicase n=1 Tax=Clostridium acetobutylicum (strain ATCC 824 / DSM 792 / JCM 1419 / IAM 19013 / LMG 5710 / NBRC 13948 / NRRL B-527 / VKM B-1787 / 2291 / W) TaxID=272562 RepID=Q97CY1_CLOAB|nr:MULTISPECIES: replicative DNA helicase [Clostridium]AAK81635.1 Replicative DNA helicase, DNAC [Clostridium acetobutylicum ATCC 824]ADZ22759.1 replicative DNA helicase [Clostridium acetobutylicum EA 2018]AEI34734.1 replicative DNA helicase [Clostridium acetobutylicum DSM 1731]AWV80690.1 replicative DNA helicase [Clostridium acetobutylicum]KHD34515.1 DNA helicase [Clostridium acetobutylicum]